MSRQNMSLDELFKMIGRGGSTIATVPIKRESKNAPSVIVPLALASAGNARFYPYKNKLEYTYAQVCEAEKLAGIIKGWAYETITLKLSNATKGKRGDYHRPDFLKWHNDGSIEIAQTKGWHKNMCASLKGLRWAAQRNPWFRFTIKRYRNGWTSEEVTANLGR